MVSPRRREVIIAGLAAAVLPALGFACQAPDANAKLVLSGRILAADRKPLAGATIGCGGTRVMSDADGRFLLITTTRDYRGLTCDGRPVEGFVANRQRDAEGTWRATAGLTLA